jgi:hypothetical protein
MKLRLGVLVMVGLALGLCGCHQRFTRERFERVQEGTDTQEDVRDILGKPKVQLADQWVYDNHKKHYSAVIHFDPAGHVVAKEWMDARTGEWEGQNPNAEPPPEGEVREQHRTTRRMDD